jgi:superfamily II DNA or RNA helicase
MKLRPYQNNLIHQVKKAYQSGYQRPCIVLGCGGGKSVIVADMARRTTDNGKRVLFLVHRQELCEQIKNTFVLSGVNMDLCQIMMVQTATRRLAKLKRPDLIITDENHHCLAQSYQRIYHYFDKVKCVGVTATPIRLNGSGLGDINDTLVVGPSTKWLIKNRYLAPYDYYAPKLIDTELLHTRNGDYNVNEITLKPAIYGDVIFHYKKLSNGGQAICYCATVAHSIEMSKQFNANGITAAHIDGTTPKFDREMIIDRFRTGDIKILTNVDLISEGFDVPDCTTSILLRPTKSLTLFIQQSMRCMRYKPDKRAIIIDHVGNYTRFGLPDDDREWSLDSKVNKKGRKADVPIQDCPECFRVFPPMKVCPYCGFEFPKKERTLKEIKETALEKITTIVMDYSTPNDCHSLKELQVYAKNHNYKPGWAYYQAKLRGFL